MRGNRDEEERRPNRSPLLLGPAPQCFLIPVLVVTCSSIGKRMPSWKLGMGVLGDLAMGRKQFLLLGSGGLHCRLTAWPVWRGKHLED